MTWLNHTIGSRRPRVPERARPTGSEPPISNSGFRGFNNTNTSNINSSNSNNSNNCDNSNRGNNSNRGLGIYASSQQTIRARATPGFGD